MAYKIHSRVSEFADPYSLLGEEKYPQKLMKKRSRSVRTYQKKIHSSTIRATSADITEKRITTPLITPPVNCSFEFDVPNEDQYAIYRRLIYETKSYVALDSFLTVYAVLDLDTDVNILKKSSPLLVIRNGKNFKCSCDKEREVFIEKVDTCSTSDTDRLFPPCFHVNVVKEIHNAFICSNEIEDVDLCCAMDDHGYIMNLKTEKEDLNLMEVPFLENVYACCVNGSYGLLQVSYGASKCLICKLQKTCQHVNFLANLLVEYENSNQPEILEKIYLTLHRYRNTSYQLSCLSTKKIPFNLPTELSQKIRKAPEEVFTKADNTLNATTETDTCPYCGGLFSDVRQKTQCILLTRYEMADIECYNKVCANSACNKVTYYDGQNDCCLNMDRFLVHYEVLRDYMYQFLFSRTTMFSFYTVWTKHQKDSGNSEFERKFPVSYFRTAWYSFMRLLDIDYTQSFVCDICLQEPKILLFDGTTLSFQKSFLGYSNAEDFSSDKLDGSHSSRVFVAHAKTRRMLSCYAKRKKQHNESVDFKELCANINEHKPVLSALMKHLESIGGEDGCPEEFREFLTVLSSNSPVCGTFHFKNIHFVEQLLESENVMENLQLLHDLQIQIPILFQLITELNSLPKCICPVLEEVIEKAKGPFRRDPHERTVSCEEDSLAFFPTLPTIYKRGHYKKDKEKSSQICCKKSTKHPSLLPGVFTVFCQHGICYGFEIMECAESPNRPFTFLLTHFHKAPEVIIYDNACNLHNYCLNRDPCYFRDTLFVVDGLHWDNHTECSIGYKALGYALLRKINTQIVEQNNAKLKKLKSSLSYMKPENFVDTLAFFLWHCNEECKEKSMQKK